MTTVLAFLGVGAAILGLGAFLVRRFSAAADDVARAVAGESLAAWPRGQLPIVFLTEAAPSAALVAACAAWNRATGLPLATTVLDSESSATVAVRYEKLDPGVHPHTVVHLDRFDHTKIVDAPIVLPDVDWSGITTTSEAALTLHEVGHALGLPHEDTIESVMHYSAKSNGISVLSVNRLTKMYKETKQ